MNADDEKARQQREPQRAPWPDDRSMVKLSREVLVNHYERRDLDAVVRAMVPDLTWVGPLDNMHAHSAEGMRRIIEPEYGTRVRLVDEDWGIRAMADSRIVVGRYGLVADGTDAEEIVFRQAATFVWAPTPAGPRVVHLHLSNSYDVPPRVEAPFEPGEDGISYTIDACTPPVTAGRRRIRFETPEGEVRFVAEDRIVRVAVDGRKSLVASDGGSFLADEPFAHLESRLPPWFVRTHRSCMANAHRVVGIRRFVLDMDDGSECPIAQHRYLEVAEAVERAAEKKIPRQQEA